MDERVMDPKLKLITDLMLNGHIAKLYSKHLNLYS